MDMNVILSTFYCRAYASLIKIPWIEWNNRYMQFRYLVAFIYCPLSVQYLKI
ncbi:hypothetical protein Hanom_Chr07g00655611 [Helianthus anomalus]